MRDLINEIWSTVSGNKLRTALTGFAVSWGIFLLICLLGAGNGLMNAFMGNSDDFVKNSVQVWGGFTSKPYAGYKQGRWIRLDKGDASLLSGAEFSENIVDVSPTTSGRNVNLVYGTNSVRVSLVGVNPGFSNINKVNMSEGRFINPIDISERRKGIVIGTNTAKALLEGTRMQPKDLIGKWLKAGDQAFVVTGLFHTDESRMGGEAFAPFSTMQVIEGNGDNLGTIVFTTRGLETEKENEDFNQAFGSRIKSRHDADPTDERALWIWNRKLGNLRMTKAQNILATFLWILGVLTLVSGIVGVSNIMLISVKERTHEFGIRKAIGAKPGAILKLIVAESVTITAVFGYIGMLLGMLACEVMDRTIGQNSVNVGFTEIHILEDPTVGLSVALEATLLLIVAGTIAGLAPARKASRVKPIEALRAE